MRERAMFDAHMSGMNNHFLIEKAGLDVIQDMFQPIPHILDVLVAGANPYYHLTTYNCMQ